MNILATYHRELLLIPVLIFGVLHIRAEYKNSILQIMVFKPLTVLLIIGIALFSLKNISSYYQLFIILGLSFSLVGDVMLMRPINKFIFGLIAFFIGHLFYTSAFVSVEGFQSFHLIGVLLFVMGLTLFIYLFPAIRKLRIPVAVYIVIISLMVWQAGGVWASLSTMKTGFAFLGAVLFCVSDMVLSVSRFRKPFILSQVIILSTYYSAQTLLAFSI